MMLDYIKTLAHYNVWANERIIDCIKVAGEEKANAIQKSSFDTILKTVFHIWDAEHIWLKRLEGSSPGSWPSKSFKGSFVEVFTGMSLTSKDFGKFADRLMEEDLKRTISYKNFKGDQFSSTFLEVVTHVFNHSTFHRGQLVTMLRAANSADIKSTDLIAYYRELAQ